MSKSQVQGTWALAFVASILIGLGTNLFVGGGIFLFFVAFMSVFLITSANVTSIIVKSIANK